MKKIYFGSNLKMYKGIKDTNDYLTKLYENTKEIDRDKFELFILPSYITLESAVNCCDQNYIRLGAQNMCWEDEGPFTGEVSPKMLEEIGIRFVMIGHSERRHVFHETDQEENQKVKSALKHGFTTLLCIGETAEEKNYGISQEILRKQIKVNLSGLNTYDLKKVRVAYEPVWSIGENGIPATPTYVEKMHKEIRKVLVDLFGWDGNKVPLLYGGSVNLENSRELISQPSIDGLFVGRSAWDADNFGKLIKSVINCIKDVR